ncbi:MAG: hypothetical protein ACE5EN_10070 [Nitrospinota bacterium]
MKYAVICKGKVKDGETVEEVKKRLAIIFKIDAGTVDRFFTGKPVIVKKGVDEDTALKIKSAFGKAGAKCGLKSYKETEQVADDEWDYDDTSQIILSMEVGFITCPKCGFEQEDLGECQKCGLLYEKYLKREGKETRVFDLP